MMLAISRFGVALTIAMILLFQSPVQSVQDAGRTPAQTGKEQLPPRISDQTYRISVDLVNVFCSAYNKDTKSYVTNLSREDFTILEDGQKQEIKNFARETNMPLNIALLVDTSQSVAPKLKFEQAAATNFFYTVLKEADRAMLVTFDTAISLVQDFTGDPNKLAKQIGKIQAAGNTALFDAIVRTCDEKLIREPGRKAIVILSDGADSASTETFERAREMAQTADATIFSVSINRGGLFGVGSDSRGGDKVLQQLANETGGKALFPFVVEDLDSAFREIGQELRSQYYLGYISSNPKRDGSYRKIEIKVRDNKLKLNNRKGYFAPTR
jgi:Ca-activated chloride channel family protein